MTSLRTTAEAYLLGLEFGVFDFDEVVDWVDATIEEMDDPPGALIDACWTGRDMALLRLALRMLPGMLDRDAAIRSLFREMGRSLAEEPASVGPVASILYRMVLNSVVPDGIDESSMYSFDDRVALAGDGICGDLGSIRREVAEFLAHDGGDGG